MSKAIAENKNAILLICCEFSTQDTELETVHPILEQVFKLTKIGTSKESASNFGG